MSSEVIVKEVGVKGSNIVVRLLRLYGSPKHYISICLKEGDGNLHEVWRSKAFLVRQDLSLTDKKIEKIEAVLERNGVPILAYKDEFVRALTEIIDAVPTKVFVPPPNELGLNFRKVRIEQLSTKYLYEPVEIEAQVIGASEFLSIPVRIELICKRHGERIRKFINFLNPKAIEQLLFKQRQLIREVELKANLRNEDEEHKFVENESRRVYIDLKILKLRDLPENVEKFSESLQFKTIDAYLIGKDLPRSKKVRVRGYVINRPLGNMNKLVLVALDIEPLNELTEKFTHYLREHPDILNDLKRLLPPYTQNSTLLTIRDRYEALKDIIDRIIAPKIVGRKFEKLATALTLVSPDKVTFESTGETFYGMLRITHYGDTKTGKTETNVYIPYVLGLGDYATCETGTRTGILYTIDTEQKIIIWGVIPLHDREVVVIDGFNAFPKDEMRELREALEHFKIIVRRFVQGDAWARTRIIAIANPKKHMKRYAFSIEGVKDISSLREEPDYTRFDLFIPWASEDVSIEEITSSNRGRDPVSEDRFRKLVLLSWNAVAIIPKDIEEKLNQLVNEIVKRAKGLDVPVIHSGWKKVVAKIASAFACLLQNFEVCDSVIIVRVNDEALEMTKLFLNEYLERLELDEYLSEMRTDLTNEEYEQLKRELRELDKAILKELYKRGRAVRSELAQLLNMTAQNLTKNYLPRLRRYRLVVSISGRGLELTDRGREFVARLLKEEGDSE